MMNILSKEVESVIFNIKSKAVINMQKQNNMNLDKILNYLDKFQVSEKSENESDIKISYQICAKVYVQPTVDPFGNNSDADSGNEEEASINNLIGNQLLAVASLEIS